MGRSLSLQTPMHVIIDKTAEILLIIFLFLCFFLYPFIMWSLIITGRLNKPCFPFIHCQPQSTYICCSSAPATSMKSPARWRRFCNFCAPVHAAPSFSLAANAATRRRKCCRTTSKPTKSAWTAWAAAPTAVWTLRMTSLTVVTACDAYWVTSTTGTRRSRNPTSLKTHPSCLASLLVSVQPPLSPRSVGDLWLGRRYSRVKVNGDGSYQALEGHSRSGSYIMALGSLLTGIQVDKTVNLLR